MANNRLTMTGLAELRAALRNLPEELTDEATEIVKDAADEAFAEARTGYASHRVSGDLERSLERSSRRRGFIARALLVNTSAHAGIFESGSQTRRTRSGTPNPMPAGKVFVPIARRARKRMFQRLKEMVVKHGFLVSGDAG